MTAKKSTGHSSKHVSSKKHAATSKHHPAAAKKSPAEHSKAKVHAKAKHAAHAKARAFAVGDLLPVCAFEALAMSLRLAGQLVDDDEVAWLWELAGADPLGASLAAALNAAGDRGLAGFRPRWKQIVASVAADHLALPLTEDEAVPVGPFEGFFAGNAHGLFGPAGRVPITQVDAPEGGRGLAGYRQVAAVNQAGHGAAVGHVAIDEFLKRHIHHDVADDLIELPQGIRVGERPQGIDAAQFETPVDLFGGPVHVHGLILGIDVPGPHCVLATADGWWSWGELHDPWPARIEEAWAVSWS